MERQALRAGAELELRDGWNVAVRFDGEDAERERSATRWASPTCLTSARSRSRRAARTWRRLSPQPAPVRSSWAARRARPLPGGARYTPERAIVYCDTATTASLRETLEEAASRAAGHASVLDVTCVFGAMTIAGPLARETFARFTALDLRPQSLPLHGFRPGSVARTPGAVLREGDDRFLMTFGFALGQYVWTVVADAAESLGGGPVGARGARAGRESRSGGGLAACLTCSAPGACGASARSSRTPMTW